MTALETRSLDVRLAGRPVLAGIDLMIDQPGVLGVIGPNGAGKSTLLRCLAGLLTADGGSVSLDGKAVTNVLPRERARRIGYLPQTPSLHWPLTVGRLVALGRLPHLAPWARPSHDDKSSIDRALQATDMTDLVDRTAQTLSGGELARALLARVIAGEPEIILADEPVAALDPLHQLRILSLFRKLADSGHIVILVLHDLTMALRFCDRLVLLDKGRIVADDDPTAMADNPSLGSAFGVAFARPNWHGKELLVPWQSENGP